MKRKRIAWRINSSEYRWPRTLTQYWEEWPIEIESNIGLGLREKHQKLEHSYEERLTKNIATQKQLKTSCWKWRLRQTDTQWGFTDWKRLENLQLLSKLVKLWGRPLFNARLIVSYIQERETALLGEKKRKRRGNWKELSKIFTKSSLRSIVWKCDMQRFAVINIKLKTCALQWVVMLTV